MSAQKTRTAQKTLEEVGSEAPQVRSIEGRSLARVSSGSAAQENKERVD